MRINTMSVQDQSGQGSLEKENTADFDLRFKSEKYVEILKEIWVSNILIQECCSMSSVF